MATAISESFSVEHGGRVHENDYPTAEKPGMELECLSAEFRHRLGLLPEEEQELSEIFKSKLGLSTIDSDRLLNLINDKDQTMRQHSLDRFAQKYFQSQKREVIIKFMEHQISQPLLMKDNPFDFQASIYIFAAISRYLKGDFSSTIKICRKPYIPIMIKIYKMIQSSSASSSPNPSSSSDPNYSKQDSKLTKSKKQLSVKKLLRTIGKAYSKKVSSSSSSSSSNRRTSATKEDESEEMPSTYEDLLSSINWELELVQFIVAHGIIRKELRDEIFCQLSCQVKNNPSKEAADRGWILHCLCTSCFMPSPQLIGPYVSFLHQMSGTASAKVNKVMNNLIRSNETGSRYHPSNYMELKAEKTRAPIKFPVHLVDGRMVEVEVDALCTSQDVCEDLSREIDLQDTFGFSLYINAYERISSLGCGADHVMDVITECEHMALDRNDLDLNQPHWVLSFRKELFTPWFDPSLDPVSTDLIYKQIKKGFSRGDFKIPKGIFEISMAQILFIEFGQLSQDLIKRKFPALMPQDYLKDSRLLERVMKDVVDVSSRMSLDTDNLDKEEVCSMFVLNVVQYLPMTFSALFEAYNYGGFPQLPQQEVIIGLNSRGIDVMGPDVTLKLAHFDFSDIYNASTNCSPELSNLTLTFLAVDGTEYSLVSPNAEVAAKITNAFLNGLRKRSRWAVAIKSFVYKDFRANQENDEFELQMGDTVELLDEIDERRGHEGDELLYGICERSSLRGAFPPDVVYVIPTARRPSQEFLDALKAVGEELSQSSEIKPLKSRVIMSDADTIRRRPDSSA